VEATPTTLLPSITSVVERPETYTLPHTAFSWRCGPFRDEGAPKYVEILASPRLILAVQGFPSNWLLIFRRWILSAYESWTSTWKEQNWCAVGLRDSAWLSPKWWRCIWPAACLSNCWRQKYSSLVMSVDDAHERADESIFIRSCWKRGQDQRFGCACSDWWFILNIFVYWGAFVMWGLINMVFGLLGSRVELKPQIGNEKKLTLVVSWATEFKIVKYWAFCVAMIVSDWVWIEFITHLNNTSMKFCLLADQCTDQYAIDGAIICLVQSTWFGFIKLRPKSCLWPGYSIQRSGWLVHPLERLLY